MQLVQWPTFAKITRYSLGVEAHTRGDAGPSGHYALARGLGARIRGEIEIAPMKTVDALAFRAFLHSLRGKSGTFLLPMPSAGGSMYTGALNGDVGEDSESITLYSPGGAQPEAQVGAWVVVGNFNSYVEPYVPQMFRIVAKRGDILSIRPRNRYYLLSNSDVYIGAVQGWFRLEEEAPAIPLLGDRSKSFTLRIVEAR